MIGVNLPWITALRSSYYVKASPMAVVVAAIAAGLMVLTSVAFSPSWTPQGAVPRADTSDPFDGPEPLSALFALDRGSLTPFVLMSTLLGPRPMALVRVGEETRVVSMGDTLAGMTVDSIGRRVVVLSRGGEVLRVGL